MSLSKLRAFVAQGFRLAWSYRLNFTARYISMFVSVLFFYFLDRMFQLSGVTVVGGTSYFAFVLVGSTISRYLDLGMRSFAQNLREEMLRGTIEPLLATAMPTSWALLAPSTWMLLEGTVAAIVQLGLGAVFGADFSQANWLAAAVVSMVSLACLLCYGILSAAFTLVFKRSDPINWLVGAISYLFSGVYFPLDILPPALRILSYALPFTYAVEGLRGALLEGQTLVQVGREILALLVFTALLLPASLWAMRAAIRHLKRTGELSHY